MSENVSVYMVVNLSINDRDEYRIYEKGFFPFLKKRFNKAYSAMLTIF